MDIRSRFRTRQREPWEDASESLIPHRWSLRASPRPVLMKVRSKGWRRGREPFGANELKRTGAEKIPTASIALATVL